MLRRDTRPTGGAIVKSRPTEGTVGPFANSSGSSVPFRWAAATVQPSALPPSRVSSCRTLRPVTVAIGGTKSWSRPAILSVIAAQGHRRLYRWCTKGAQGAASELMDLVPEKLEHLFAASRHREGSAVATLPMEPRASIQTAPPGVRSLKRGKAVMKTIRLCPWLPRRFP